MIYRGAVREDIEGPRFLCNLRKIIYKSRKGEMNYEQQTGRTYQKNL